MIMNIWKSKYKNKEMYIFIKYKDIEMLINEHNKRI